VLNRTSYKKNVQIKNSNGPTEVCSKKSWCTVWYAQVCSSGSGCLVFGKCLVRTLAMTPPIVTEIFLVVLSPSRKIPRRFLKLLLLLVVVVVVVVVKISEGFLEEP
jgi:hypothetical protein